MSKKILITVFAFALIAVVLFSFLIFTKKYKSAPTNVVLYQNEENELDLFKKDLALFSEDAALFSEIDQTFMDILDASESALEESSILKEEEGAGFFEDLKSLGDGDESVLNETNQAFAEILQ